MTQRVVVTGGASGLGKAIARRYADTGASVVIADIDPAGKQTAAELGAHFHELDVTDAASFDALVRWCEAQLGGLDVLVNNAGVAAAGRFERVSLEDWDWILDINLMGVVRGCRAVVPLFKRQGSGHLVNIASLAALTTLPAMSSYNVSKAGVVALSQTLRHELAPYGIGTTVVCPGFVRTNLSSSLRSPDPEAQAVTERLMDRSDVTPEDVAEQVVAAQRKNTFLVLTHAEGRKFRFLERFLPALADKARIGFWQRLRSKIEAAPDVKG
ncbi:MAG: SDR family oxidoreductase [Actinophytocola sp.]|nr:SDR family oxidoreductase [Actinophytocola sp.]